MYVWVKLVSEFEPILPCLRVYDDLLFSLVGLNLDFSEWAKLGIMNDVDRLDYHWASWTNFAQARVFCVLVLRSFTYLLSLP